MDIDVIFEDLRWQDAGLQACVEAAAGVLAADMDLPEGAEAVVMGCDDGRIATLNADFRGKGQPTNVLSWPSEERGADTDGETPLLARDPELGDIALAFETCMAEAAKAGIPVRDHVTHLVLHGLLHLLGYDHIRDGDATLMETKETQLLGKLGIADPY